MVDNTMTPVILRFPYLLSLEQLTLCCRPGWILQETAQHQYPGYFLDTIDQQFYQAQQLLFRSDQRGWLFTNKPLPHYFDIPDTALFSTTQLEHYLQGDTTVPIRCDAPICYPCQAITMTLISAQLLDSCQERQASLHGWQFTIGDRHVTRVMLQPEHAQHSRALSAPLTALPGQLENDATLLTVLAPEHLQPLALHQLTCHGLQPATFVLARFISDNITALARYQQKLVAGDDAAALHDYRIQLRRCRTLFCELKNELPETESKYIDTKLRILAQRTNALRDTDVLIAHLSQQQTHDDVSPMAIKQWHDHAETERRRLHGQLRRWLNSQTYQQILAGIQQRLQRCEHLPGNALAKHMQQRFKHRLKKVEKTATQALKQQQPDDFHQLRKQFKKLRYTIELLVLPVTGTTFAPAIKTLKKQLHLLGQLQDNQIQATYLNTQQTKEAEETAAILTARQQLHEQQALLLGQAKDQTARWLKRQLPRLTKQLTKSP